jgi:hypothetical protein
VTVVFSIVEYDYMADELTRIGAFERGRIERDVFPDGGARWSAVTIRRTAEQ